MNAHRAIEQAQPSLNCKCKIEVLSGFAKIRLEHCRTPNPVLRDKACSSQFAQTSSVHL